MNQNKVFWFTMMCLASFLLGQYTGEKNADKYVDFEVPTDIIKTVAHVDIVNDNLKLLHKDISSDIAYYQFVGVRDICEIGDVVHLYDGTEFVVVSASINGFNLAGDEPVTVGMSGMAILDEENNQIGYVSSLLPTGEVYCIWS